MSALVIEIPAIADTALEVMKRVIDENESTLLIKDADSGPIPLAAAMSDFFQLASAIENGDQELDPAVINDLADYSLDLVERLSYQLRQLDIHDQRDNLARVASALAVWLARRDAVLTKLDATGEGFANLVNSENDPAGLVELSRMMDEVIEAASDEIRRDEDRSNPWRPWRVLNLNAGVAATRALDADAMSEIFEKLEDRLPYDLPGFFGDGKRQMDTQEVPEDIRDVLAKFAAKWPEASPH